MGLLVVVAKFRLSVAEAAAKVVPSTVPRDNLNDVHDICTPVGARGILLPPPSPLRGQRRTRGAMVIEELDHRAARWKSAADAAGPTAGLLRRCTNESKPLVRHSIVRFTSIIVTWGL